MCSIYIFQNGLQTEYVERTFHNISLGQLIVKGFLQVLYAYTYHLFVVYKSSHDFFCQIRSRQFEDFPSNWSEAKVIEFVILRRPDPVRGLAIDFTTVDIVCSNNQTFLELDVGATWSKASIPEGTMFDNYEFSVKDLQSIFLDKQETESVDMELQRIALDSREPSLDIKFQVCSGTGVCMYELLKYPTYH